MKNNKSNLAQKWAILAVLTVGITLLHYNTEQSLYYFHVFYGELYCIPIVLAGFWFGLRGALLVSTTITVFYLPFIYWHWQGLSPNALDSILSLCLYNGLALLTGALKDRETATREMVLQTDNLIVMGKSLAAAAHDMRSPLMLIGGFARRILKNMDDHDPARPKLTLIIQETEKMERMAEDMLDFSKPLALTKVRGNIDTTVRNGLAKVQEAARKKRVSVEYHPSPEPVDIKFDSVRFEQALINLIQNAVEASPEGDTVTIALSVSSLGSPFLDVADNGSGIPLAKRQKVFDPFFTTKKEGTGLGLPIVKKIIDAHGWSLQILDNNGGGTICRIMLKEGNGHDCIHQ
ncbi:signal transduction histidine kinase [Desulfocapsa sulfexigens DSM 10523]|uniref:histidine kinase n=1 Tax=Desulfocapsa sulfexigens (strain DSM 10523 / SB164P1) TaxID=1167006 RepID=M1PTC2_DESSD|nr:ATP-binding protein [Desulfocapsa sulfexigens]AGF79576.1 signal transduction histidine kinase [Desulfocapsa sulfexigens DSM 10523]